MIQGDRDVLGHPQRPRQAQPWRVPQVPSKIDMAHVYLLFLKDKSIQNDNNFNHVETHKHPDPSYISYPSN